MIVEGYTRGYTLPCTRDPSARARFRQPVRSGAARRDPDRRRPHSSGACRGGGLVFDGIRSDPEGPRFLPPSPSLQATPFGRSRKDTHGHLVLDASDVEQRLDLLPQLPPWPSAELKVFPQVPLDDHKSQALFLEFLVIFARYVTPDVSLHPGHNLAETLIAELLHLTQDSGSEEYLFFFAETGNEKDRSL
ncbi:hypothetical protein X777_10689 [Ooceraea biroi]|uniref:Uncharacterized protein n=1 Tax=Ooceraea biroi TaxID=2015173 RepID=A0A026W4H2_OOCBI|nr:hypothetical protein X777_10689 [Ooceraea biroi]